MAKDIRPGCMGGALKFAIEENGRTARVGGFVGKVICCID